MTEMDKKEFGSKKIIDLLRKAKAKDNRIEFAALCFSMGLAAAGMDEDLFKVDCGMMPPENSA